MGAATRPPPPLEVCMSGIFVLVCKGIQDKDEGNQFLQNIGIWQTTCYHIPEDYCYIQLWEPQVLQQFLRCMEHFVLALITKQPSRILELKLDEVTWWRKSTHWGASKFIFFSKRFSIKQIKEYGMGRTCIISLGTVKKCILNFSLIPWQKETIGHVWIWGCGLDASVSG